MEVLRVGNDAYFMNLKPLSIITPGARGAFSHEHGHFPYNNLKLQAPFKTKGGRGSFVFPGVRLGGTLSPQKRSFTHHVMSERPLKP